MTRMAIALTALLATVYSHVSPARGAQLYIDALYGFSKTTAQYGVGTTTSGPVPLMADIYQPAYNGEHPVQPNRPAIVIQDGGAWSTADRTNSRVTDFAKYQARRGYTVIVTDYRQGASVGGQVTATVGNTEWGNDPYQGLSFSFPYNSIPGTTAIRAGIEDFAVAMDWVRDNDVLLGIDRTRIGIAGGSAGGIDALLLQYNNNPVRQAYRAKAVVALVSSMFGNQGRIQAGGPPVFLLNNTQDLVVPWSPAMSQKFVDVGIYREQWFQPADSSYHGIDWNLDLNGLPLKERVRDFLAYQLAGGPVPVPEPSTVVLAGIALAAVSMPAVRRRLFVRKNR